MQLNRVNAPNEGATGVDLTNEAAVNNTAADARVQDRAGIAMVRTHDVKIWRGVPDKTRLRVAPPPGKVLAEPVKGGWFNKIRQMLQARTQSVQAQSAQRQAALGLEQSPGVQAGPGWLRGMGLFRGRLQGIVAKLKERAAPPTTPTPRRSKRSSCSATTGDARRISLSGRSSRLRFRWR